MATAPSGSGVPFLKRLDYEAIPSTPGSSSSTGPDASTSYQNQRPSATTVIRVGPIPKLQQPSFSKPPRTNLPRLASQPALPPADDPFRLSEKVVSEEELSTIKNRDVRAFYRRQNELIDMFLNPPTVFNDEDPESGEMSKDTKVKIAVWASTIANGFLFAGQGYAAWITGSLALFATMADAMMDLLSSIILLLTGRATRHVDKHRFPTGKSRLEVLGVVVFATLMSTVAIQLIIEGIKGIISSGPESKETDKLAIAFIVGALVMKTILLIYCLTLREFLSARTLAQGK